MPRYATVLSDSESEDDDDDADDADRNDDEDDADDPRVHQLLPLVEAYEFAIRNVQFGGKYLEFASAQHERLKSMSVVFFQQSVSPRWSVAFIAVLKRARAFRIRTLFGDDDKDAVSTGGSCLACGAKEQHCMQALELVGDDGSVNECEFTDLADRLDALDTRDLATHASKFGPYYYYGVFGGGAKCLDLATAAVLARNLILDTCVDLRNALDQVLNDETVVEQLERDEHATNPQIEPLTDCLVVARRLVTRIRTIEDVLRGKPYPVDPSLQRTGPGVVWQKLDEHLNQRCTTQEATLKFGGERARALVRGTVVPNIPKRPAPPPANAGVLDPPVSARTRGSAQREAPVSSRTRTRRA